MEITVPETVEDTQQDVIEQPAGSGQVEEKKSAYPTQTILTIRAIVGGYVMYLAYQIIMSDGEISPWMWAAIAVFIVAGSALVITSVKHFICGEYEGGKKDV